MNEQDLAQWRGHFWTTFAVSLKGLAPNSPGWHFLGGGTEVDSTKQFDRYFVSVESVNSKIRVEAKRVHNPTNTADDFHAWEFEERLDHAPPAAMAVASWLRPKVPKNLVPEQ